MHLRRELIMPDTNSGGKKGKVPGITGIMDVLEEAEPDLSAFDENSAYYVENVKNRGTEAKPRWYMVHVEFRKKLSKPVTYVFFDPNATTICLQQGSAQVEGATEVYRQWRCVVGDAGVQTRQIECL